MSSDTEGWQFPIRLVTRFEIRTIKILVIFESTCYDPYNKQVMSTCVLLANLLKNERKSRLKSTHKGF